MGLDRIAVAAALALAACGASPSPAGSEWLKRAIASAKPGAVIEIPAGDYDLKDVRIAKSLTLRGDPDGGTVFRSAETTEKGILVPLSGVDLTIENVGFEGAKSWDRNGAGIRHEGRRLAILNCRFISNEDGILATGDPDGVITIARSRFVDSGFGDGQSHAIYVVNGRRLEVVDSEFVGTRIGHHVKSLAAETLIRGSLFDDAYGRSSYAVDASKGGDVTIEGNQFVQSADADNHAIINYDLTRGGEARRLTIVGNKVVNRFDGGVFVRNDTDLPPTMRANSIVNEGRRPMATTSPGSPRPTPE
jgi:hypothetical protein